MTSKYSRHTTGTRSMPPPARHWPWGKPWQTPGARGWTTSQTGPATAKQAPGKLARSDFQYCAAAILWAITQSTSVALENASKSHTARAVAPQIGRAHVCTPVTNAQHVCRLLLEK